MTYFNNDFVKFFKDLEKNNHKEWFDKNRKRYQSSVKDPFYTFVDEMITRINERDPSVQITAKDAVMRINRDIRFSPDKTPYNVHYGAIISSSGRKDKSVPGYFIRFSPKMIGIFGGAHGIDKHQLHKIRSAIKDDLPKFKKLISQKQFVEKYGEIQGEKHKRIPPEFQEAASKEPLIANKQFYYMAELSPKLIVQENLPDILMDYWDAAQNVKDFLTEAMK
ncbi:MAG: DUF2461 domain-containing protein [Cyclobacteriaceae bacterium]|nr:DUF2461 domain-containing protein [Cyclobacteriaceae bacterium]